ncbi:MAG: hypothetical protein WCK53_16270, partial [Methanomicrobiales archaeon]
MKKRVFLIISNVFDYPLEKIDEPFRIDKFNELFAEEKKDTARKDSTKKAATAKTQAADSKPITIDMD